MSIPNWKKSSALLTIALAACTAAANATAFAQVEGPQTTRVLARAESKGAAPSLRVNNVTVSVAGRDVPTVGVTPLVAARAMSDRSTGQPVEVALVVDEGLRENFNTNLIDIRKFVRTTASSAVSIGVGYMRNGSVYFANGFSTDPEVAVKSVRLPLQSPGISGSPYICLKDLARHWPTKTGAARVVLMITNGIDPYNGSVSPLNQNSPYVDQAIEEAQKAAIPMYSIYFGGRGINAGYGSFSGQDYLSHVAEDTGGEMYNQGTITPPSITPYLNQFGQALSQTYAISFQDSGSKLERLKLSTTDSSVKLHAQHEVRAGQPRSEAE